MRAGPKARGSGARTARKRDPSSSASPAPPAVPASFGSDSQLRFVVAFAIIAGCLLTLYYFPRGSESAGERWIAEYLRFYTRLARLPIAIFDPNVSAHGNTVSGRFSMQIVKSCDAMEANILFSAAILAFAASWWRKIAALFVGLSALLTFNLVRLVVLYWVGVFAYPAFEFMHYDLWPLLMVAFASVDFILCVRWVLGMRPPPVADDAA